MKQLRLIITITGFSLLLFAGKAWSQPTSQGISQGSLDSLQRRMLKDSLSVSDGIIDTISMIRTQFREATAAVYQETGLSEEQRRQRFAILKDNTNQQVKDLLGNTLFNRYLHLIQGVRQRRGNPTGSNPLSGVVQ